MEQLAFELASAGWEKLAANLITCATSWSFSPIRVPRGCAAQNQFLEALPTTKSKMAHIANRLRKTPGRPSFNIGLCKALYTGSSLLNCLCKWTQFQRRLTLGAVWGERAIQRNPLTENCLYYLGLVTKAAITSNRLR